ncbi:PREDICTED: uncharacterized protein LOC104728224 [Camelina sativa]|uniref:Uncharacterized protein LOC104728224 n=1 Tax=Camelina sativa TaxID=90675 RepID=A0ABM0USH7_CAMSA|nr:PREDICTED: uncharacterized protein LOC104728224 [Camelina sativa]
MSKSMMQVQHYKFGLDNPPRRAIVASIRRHFDGPWYYISSVHNESLMQWWGDFIQSFFWDDALGGKVYHLWYHVLSGRLRDMISKAKVLGTKPKWISGEIWETMQEYWGTDASRKKSKIASANRMSCRDGFDPHAHTSGSQSYDQLRELIRQQEGIEPSMLRILRETHRKSDGTYVDDKARSIEEEIQRQIDAISQASDGASLGASSSIEEDELFYKVVPSQNGRNFGLGGQNYIRERGESSAGALERISLERQLTSLQEKMATVVEFMNQYMTAGASHSFPSVQQTNAIGASVTTPIQTNNRQN